MKRGVPQPRRPVLPPWSKADCPDCGDPVEYVTLDVATADTGQRIAVERAVYKRGTIAARMIGNKLHGYRIGEFEPVREGFIPMREHTAVCEFAVPPAEQRPLF